MGRIDREKLLAPVSGQMPCGEDLSDLTEYYVLEELAKGKEETQYSKAEPPEWPKVLKLSEELLGQGKEMWVVVYLLHALVGLDGAKGLAEGLGLLSEMLNRYWEEIFPGLDEDDENPAEQRMNILSGLSAPGGMFMECVRNLPLCRSRQLGSFSWRQILLARGEIQPGEGEEIPPESVIEGAIRDTDTEELAGIRDALAESVETIGQLDGFLTGQLGAAHNTSGIVKLADFLEKMRGPLESAAALPVEREVPAPELPGEGKGEKPAALRPLDAIGELGSQNDVISVLDQITAWYERNEPSSPVPLIVRRARGLVGKSFMEIIRAIASQAEGQVAAIAGTKEESGTESPSAPQGGGLLRWKIDSPGDVVASLEKLCDWYAVFEPSSPVPLYLERARRLVGKNFMDIIDDVASKALDQVAGLVGNQSAKQ